MRLSEGIDELQKLLELGIQYWFLGAGASFESNIPLMYPLTSRVEACLKEPYNSLFNKVKDDLPTNCHVEHVLSHIGDMIAIAERSTSKKIKINNEDFNIENLKEIYKKIIEAITITVRFGYSKNGQNENIGDLINPIVNVDFHKEFVRQIFKRRANLEERSRISFITTNYDTLLEDALVLNSRIPIDGFLGTSIAFWNGKNLEDDINEPKTHKLLKLHGSVDWFKGQDAELLRIRYGVNYHSDLSNTLIYPQATKYIETQKDPFAKIFDCFRKLLRIRESHILAIVGYSFGDDHINSEIELALKDRNNKTNIIAFSKEVDNKLPQVLEKWRNDPNFGSRIYIATDRALYCQHERTIETSKKDLNWWTFSGLTKFLEKGEV